MRILIIDQCSGSKDYPGTHPVVEQDQTGDGCREELLDRLGIEGIPANELYNGKQQNRIDAAVRLLKTKDHDVDRFFISAGFGLVGEEVRLPPYEATFNEMSSEEIDNRACRFELTDQIQDLLEDGEYDVAFFALGSKYYEAIDLDTVLSSAPRQTTVALFNQESRKKDYENVVSIPARTEDGKEFGSTVVGLKGTYLKQFANAVEKDRDSISQKEVVEYCRTKSTDGEQSGIDGYT